MTVAAFALAVTTAAAQVPPKPATPPPAPAPAPTAPVPMPVPVVAPAQRPLLPPVEVPLLPPLPPIPVDIDRALIEAEIALAAMPPMETIQAKMVEAELAMARAASTFDRMELLPSFEFSFADQSGLLSTDARNRDRESSYYEQGRSALDRRNWTDAVRRFEQVIELKGARADAAMYWKAYAQSKNAQRAEALATIAAMLQAYPQSRYLNDAKALEIDLKRGEVTPESQQDEDLKLLAIQGLQHSDPEQAIPLLEKILTSSNGPRVKERALYVLALSSSARAQDILLGIAKGGANPDLQRKAIDYLATRSRNDGSSRLEEVYRANSDPDVRLRVLRAYASAGDRARLLAVAQSEQNEELRMAAIRYLGPTGAIPELAQLYNKETNQAIRLQIVRSIASARRDRTGTMLQDMYAKESTPEIKRAIISALHSQNNPEGLVAIARRETDPKLKEEIVRRLSTMTKSKVALDYLMEILNK